MDFTKIQGKSSLASSASAAATTLASSAQSSSGSSATSSELTSKLKIEENIKTINEADTLKQVLNSVLSAANKASEELANTLSSLVSPIYDAIRQFSTVPLKIRSIVDIQGAEEDMYAQQDQLFRLFHELKTTTVSSEVPIEVDDFFESPDMYPDLVTVLYQKNDVTQQDCDKSSYKKIKVEVKQEWVSKPITQFAMPEDRDIVAEQMEKIINSTIKTTWNTIQQPIETIASVASLGSIPDMIKSIVKAIDSIVIIASKTVSDDELDKMVAAKDAAEQQQKDAAKTEVKALNPVGKSVKERVSDTYNASTKSICSAAGDALEVASGSYASAKKAAAGASSGLKDGVKNAFKNLQAPLVPDDVKRIFEDFKDALQMVKDNISNIYIIVILKMLQCVLKCLNDICGVIGVPVIPDPLGKLPLIINDAMTIIKFVMGLPMSLMKCLEAIFKKKMKMIQLGMTPVPPAPTPVIAPTAPTSKDVVKPDLTWDDIIDKLKNDYKFSGKDASKISKDIQEFYDGSDSEGSRTGVYIAEPIEHTNPDGSGYRRPTVKYIERYKLSATDCFNKFIDNNISKMVSDGQTQYYISIPEKGNGQLHFYYEKDSSGNKSYVSYDDLFWITSYYSA